MNHFRIIRGSTFSELYDERQLSVTISHTFQRILNLRKETFNFVQSQASEIIQSLEDDSMHMCVQLDCVEEQRA